MSDAPLLAGPVFGLRSWRVAAGPDGEVLSSLHRTTGWPPGGQWLRAQCGAGRDHEVPAGGCICGVHAWHPSRASTRRVLASRFEVPGIVAGAGAIEVHPEGFRAERARPHAFAALPGRNRRLLERLAARHDAQVVDVRGPDDLLAYCREHGLGLGEDVVDGLLGPGTVARLRDARRHRMRRDVGRVAAAAAVSAGLFAAGLAFVTDDGPKDLVGRTGKVHVP